MTAKSIITKAKKLFLQRDYAQSLELFNEAYLQSPKSKEARLGILLCDIAFDNEEQAQKLFEYYQIIKAQKVKAPQNIIFDLIKTLDYNVNHIATMINESEDNKIGELDGISYDDFKALVANSDFKTIFEHSLFSTKIIFTKKNDFYEFLNLLIDNGLINISMQYLEALQSDIIYDFEIQKILKKALNHENKNQ